MRILGRLLKALLVVGASFPLACAGQAVEKPEPTESRYFEIIPRGVSLGISAEELQKRRGLGAEWQVPASTMSDDNLAIETLKDHGFFQTAIYAAEQGRLVQISLDVYVSTGQLRCSRQRLLLATKSQWGDPTRAFVSQETIGMFPRDHIVYEWDSASARKDIVIYLSSFRDGLMSLAATVRDPSSVQGRIKRRSKGLSPEEFKALEREAGLDEESLHKTKLECPR